MEINKSAEGTSCTVKMAGKFSFSDHSSFKELLGGFKDGSIKDLSLHMENVEFVDSAALGLLLLAKEEAEKTNVRLRIVGPQGQVKKMFEISHFYDLFDISDA